MMIQLRQIIESYDEHDERGPLLRNYILLRLLIKE